MSDAGLITGAAFAMVSSLVLLLSVALSGRRNRVDARLDELAGRDAPTLDPVREIALRALPRMGQALVPKDQDERTKLQARLVHAGYYGRAAIFLFFGIKLILMILPPFFALLLGVTGLVSPVVALLLGGCGGIAGMIGPSFWIDHKKKQRQTAFRRALPDALDVVVICLEGGLSLHGALRRVAAELRTAHPLLARELNIAQREIQLGQTAGDSLRHFADRADLEEIRGLASVITQSERFGASLVKALRTHAETLRGKRLLYAEEMAQKAAIKILFPTLFCIFPGLFLVILGPAVMQVMPLIRSLAGR
jgi:tight adherence protein C